MVANEDVAPDCTDGDGDISTTSGGDSRALAVLTAAEVMLSPGISQVDLARCPECKTPTLLEDAGNQAVCGYCGHGPWVPELS